MILLVVSEDFFVGLLGCWLAAGIAPSIPGLPGVTPQVPAGMTPVMSLVTPLKV